MSVWTEEVRLSADARSVWAFLTPLLQQTSRPNFKSTVQTVEYGISTVPTALPVPCPTVRAQLRGMQSNDDGHNFWMQSSRVPVWEKNLWKPKSCKLDELMSEVCFYAAYGTTGVAAALTLVYTSESCTWMVLKKRCGLPSSTSLVMSCTILWIFFRTRCGRGRWVSSPNTTHNVSHEAILTPALPRSAGHIGTYLRKSWPTWSADKLLWPPTLITDPRCSLRPADF